jgi:hypothetical protein
VEERARQRPSTMETSTELSKACATALTIRSVTTICSEAEDETVQSALHHGDDEPCGREKLEGIL